jgi:hypothetical protein
MVQAQLFGDVIVEVGKARPFEQSGQALMYAKLGEVWINVSAVALNGGCSWSSGLLTVCAAAIVSVRVGRSVAVISLSSLTEKVEEMNCSEVILFVLQIFDISVSDERKCTVF